MNTAIPCLYKVVSQMAGKVCSNVLLNSSDKSVTSLITWDRGGEWQSIPLTAEQCKGVGEVS